MQASFEHLEESDQSSWHLQCRAEPDFPFLWHFHEEFELTLVTASSGSRFVGDSIEDFCPPDLTLIGPALPHTYVSDPASGPARAFVIQFRPDFLGSEFFATPDLLPLADLLVRAARGVLFPPGAAARLEPSLSSMDALPPCERTLLLLQVLAKLARTDGYRQLATEGYVPNLSSQAQERIDLVCSYLHANYTRPIAFEDLAGMACMSPAAFSRFFHRITGRTLTAYVNELRLAAVCRLLVQEESESVAVIALRCGYRNLSNFNRRFRELKHMSPSQYRARFREPTNVPRG